MKIVPASITLAAVLAVAADAAQEATFDLLLTRDADSTTQRTKSDFVGTVVFFGALILYPVCFVSSN